MDGMFFWVLAVLAAMLVGASKGGVPIVGMLGVPLLSVAISPVTAAGLLLPIYVVSDMFGLYAYRHSFDKRIVAIVVAGGTMGIILGWATAGMVSEAAVTLVVGLIGVVFALILLTRRDGDTAAKPAKIGPGLFWGAVTGFTSFVSHSGAPPYQVYTLPLKMEKAVFAGTTTVVFTFINAIKLIPYYALGQLNPANLKVAALIAVPSIIAVFAGVRLVRILPEQLFFKIITWALLGVSLHLIWKGLSGL